MAKGSDFARRHRNNPPAGECSRSFIENQLRGHVERHEGFNFESGWHTAVFRDLMNQHDFGSRFEGQYAADYENVSEWRSAFWSDVLSELNRLSPERPRAEFLAASIPHNPLPTIGCNPNWFP